MRYVMSYITINICLIYILTVLFYFAKYGFLIAYLKCLIRIELKVNKDLL